MTRRESADQHNVRVSLTATLFVAVSLLLLIHVSLGRLALPKVHAMDYMLCCTRDSKQARYKPRCMIPTGCRNLSEPDTETRRMFGWRRVSINLSQSISKSGDGEECSRKDPVGRGRRGEGVETDADETRTCWKRVVLYMGLIIKQKR